MLPLAAVVAAVLAPPAWPQGGEAVTLDPVEVKAAPVGEDAVVEPTRPSNRLTGEALRERLGATLGETVGDELGVSNASFGPGVGLPVIRGLTGPRVRVLTNGLPTHDAGMFSPDHATTADPVLADEVRVLRGPATIRYGGAAIGGAVDVLDGRIPSAPPQRPLAGSAAARYGFNGGSTTAGLRLDGGDRVVALHADGFVRRRGNVAIPGCAIDDAAVRQQFGVIAFPNSCGVLLNSDAESSGGSVGGSVFSDRGYVGGALSQLLNNYGIPPGPGSHGGAGDIARIDLNNRRADGRLEVWGDGKWIEALRVDFGQVRYRHDEVENGVIATTFKNDATDWRMEVDHRLGPNVRGVVGGQLLDRDFSALGAEAFIPATTTDMSAFYVVERATFGAVDLEGGWRREWLDIAAGPQRTVDRRLLTFPAREFTAGSYSVAATWRFVPQASVRGILSRAERAPEVSELYSFGPHLATRTFDQGNAALRKEATRSFDLTLAGDVNWARGSATLFWTETAGFIFQRTVGGIFWDTEENRFRARCVRLEECLPVVRYDQSDARFNGYELELAFRLSAPVVGQFELALFADQVTGRLTSRNEDVPRLPPRRYGVQLTRESGPWLAWLRWMRADAQEFPGANETPTAGYDLLNAYLAYRTRVSRFAPIVFLRARNLLDEEIRYSTSFLRNYAPEPGRSIELGLQVSF